jgi:hypothetical protein
LLSPAVASISSWAFKTKKPSVKEGFVDSENALRPRSTNAYTPFKCKSLLRRCLKNVDSYCRHLANVPEFKALRKHFFKKLVQRSADFDLCIK